MPRFRYAPGSPLLPAQDAQALGLSRKRQRSWTKVGVIAGPLLLSLSMGGVLLMTLTVLQTGSLPDATGADSVALSGDVEGAGAAQVGQHTVELPLNRTQHRNAELKLQLDALIVEATQVAKDQGILTETDAAEEEQRRSKLHVRDWSHLLEVAEGGEDADSPHPACAAQDCFPHGVCQGGRCRCAAAYTGKYCGHGVLLSWPFRPDSMLNFTATYHGEFILHDGISDTQLQIPAAASADGKAEPVLLDEASLAKLKAALPAGDASFKGRAYESCAVVGSSGTLLLSELGAEIDGHTMVFRADAAPTAGFGAHVGSRTDIRVTDSGSWGFSEGPGEVCLVRSQSPAVLQGLRWAAEQPQRPTLVASHPQFDSYVARCFAHGPSSALYAAALALQTCQSVRLYGLVPPANVPGLPCLYYQPCATPEERGDWQQQELQVVTALAHSGLAPLGVPCAEACMSSSAACAACMHATAMPAALA